MPYGRVFLGDTEDNEVRKYFRIAFGQFHTSVKIMQPQLNNADDPKVLDEAKQAEQHSKFFRVRIHRPSIVQNFGSWSKIENWSQKDAGMIVGEDAVPLMTEFCLAISKINNVDVLTSLNKLKQDFIKLHREQQDVRKFADKNEGKLEQEIRQVTVQQHVEEFAYLMWELKLQLQGKMYETKCAKNEGTEAKLIFVEPISEI
eukprot:GHVT01042927.1.p1 GENE.GHVT01042927.1~~GHVT01042927.1.p1  ORF type:complete len:202 (-),score=15.56 GHVT01042927.1:95-700(-)